jgi:hypothetical protein
MLLSHRETIPERMAPIGPDTGWLGAETMAGITAEAAEAALRLRGRNREEAA